MSLILVSTFGFGVWIWLSESEVQKIKQVVEESQKYESLVLYKNPAKLELEKLNRYWLNDEYNDELDVKKVRAGAERLMREGKYYGNETKCEQFEFQFIEINETKDSAIVKTLEKWFIAEYLNNGTLFRNKTIGPYSVNYLLKKKDGKWLKEKSSTPRAKPAPTQQ